MTKLKLSEMLAYPTIAPDEMMTIKGGTEQDVAQSDTCAGEQDCETSGGGGGSNYSNGWTFNSRGDTVARDSTSVASKYWSWIKEQVNKERPTQHNNHGSGVER